MLWEAEARFEKKSKETPSVEETLSHYRAALEEPWYLVNPEGKFMQRWDFVTTIALLFTAVITPYEVALVNSPDFGTAEELLGNGLWVVNQVVNLVFLFDMVLSFFTMYRESANNGGAIIRDLSKIRTRYIRGWLFIDVVSIIPFGYVPGAGALGILRMIRILRLLKLARVLRASRIYQRFQARNSMPHSVEALIKLLVLLVTLAHWMACAWIMSATMQSPNKYTWMDSLAETYGFCEGGDDGCDVYPSRDALKGHGPSVYFAALYWSVVTITSVGYGDITSKNTDEMLLCTVYLLLGAVVWAYIIGNAVTIISTGDPDLIEHFQTMDSLNKYIKEKSLPEPIQLRLRRFFRNRREMTKQNANQNLLNMLSPKLMEDVCESTAAFLRGVSYFKNESFISVGFLVNIQSELSEAIYEPRESIRWNDCLNVVSRGVASVQGRICPVGFIWGEDFVLDSLQLKDKRSANSLTYVTVLVLRKESFSDVLMRYPIEQRYIRKMTVRLAFRRSVLAWAYMNRSEDASKFSTVAKQVADADAVGAAENDAARVLREMFTRKDRGGAADMFGASAVGGSQGLKISKQHPGDGGSFSHEAEARLEEKLANATADLLRALNDSASKNATLISAQTKSLAAKVDVLSQRISGPSAADPLGPPPALAAGWTSAFSEAHQRHFYVNTSEGKSSWIGPPR